MFQHIAVGLDGSTHAASAEELAIGLARRLGASVHGIHVIDTAFLEGAFITDISGAMGFEPFLNLQAQVRGGLDELAGAIRTRFLERCAEAGVDGTFHLEHAAVVHGILAAARLADLLVVGRCGVNAQYHKDLVGPTTCSLLRRSLLPLLVVPETASLPKSPLAAYDGSPKAVRALRETAELCHAMSLPLTVITVDEDTGKAQARLDEAAAYLKPFGVDARFCLEPGVAVEQVLLAQLEPGDFDLLSLGAHGHNRIVELVLGSTTEFLTRRAPVPVLTVSRA